MTGQRTGVSISESLNAKAREILDDLVSRGIKITKPVSACVIDEVTGLKLMLTISKSNASDYAIARSQRIALAKATRLTRPI